MYTLYISYVHVNTRFLKRWIHHKENSLHLLLILVDVRTCSHQNYSSETDQSNFIYLFCIINLVLNFI